MSSRTRRSVILATSTALPVLPGCTRSSLSDPDKSTTTTSKRTREPTTRRPSETPTRSPAPESTTHRPTPEEVLSFGEWFDDGSLRYAVEEIELASSFVTDDGNQHSMPTDKQLLLVTTTVKNRDAERYERIWGSQFVALVDGELYQDTFRIRTSTGEKLDVDELSSVEHIRQWGPEGQQIDPGETVTSWFTFVVPERATRSEIEIALNRESSDNYGFPVRWRPDEP